MSGSSWEPPGIDNLSVSHGCHGNRELVTKRRGGDLLGHACTRPFPSPSPMAPCCFTDIPNPSPWNRKASGAGPQIDKRLRRRCHGPLSPRASGLRHHARAARPRQFSSGTRPISGWNLYVRVLSYSPDIFGGDVRTDTQPCLVRPANRDKPGQTNGQRAGAAPTYRPPAASGEHVSSHADTRDLSGSYHFGSEGGSPMRFHRPSRWHPYNRSPFHDVLRS